MIIRDFEFEFLRCSYFDASSCIFFSDDTLCKQQVEPDDYHSFYLLADGFQQQFLKSFLIYKI